LPLPPAQLWLVDDSPLQSELTVRLLRQAYQVQRFAAGEDMLEQLSQGSPPDLILLDWELPGISGPDICRYIRELHDEVSLPILMVAARGTREDVTEGLEAGANDYLSKPFHEAELLARVRTLVRTHQQARLLREREAAQATTLRSIADAVIATNASGRITFLNPVAEALTGWRSHEARDLPVDDVFRIVSEHHRGPVESPVTRVIREGVVVEIANHTLLIRKDGTEVPIDDSAAPIRDEHGGLAGVVLVFRDVTGKKRAEDERERLLRELQASNNRLHGILEHAPAFVCTLRGPEHVFAFLNPRYHQLVGASRARTVVGRPVAQALPEVVEQGFIDLLDRVYRTGEPFHGNEVPIQLDRGASGLLEKAYLNFVYQPRRDAQGQVDGIDAFGFDVTAQVVARQQAEALSQKLRESEERLRRVVEASGAGLWDMDAATGVIESDSRMRVLMGMPPDSPFTHGTALDHLPAADRGRVNAAVTAALAGKDGGRYHIEFRTGGHGVVPPRWVESRGQVIFDGTGQATRLAGAMVEITPRKTVELEAKVRSDFEKQLIGIVSHDLRNPLNAIVMSAAMLARREEPDARAAKNVLRIQSSAQRAIRMIRDLLDFTQARLGSGIHVSCAPLDLGDLARHVVDELETAHPGRELRVRTEGDTRGEWDADRMTQALGNLLSNALQYSPEGTAVTVATRVDARWTLLEVHNHGVPIPPGKLPLLFEPMQRGQDELGSVSRSVGLGLYIVDQIVRAHGGRVDVSSSALEGTTFTVKLPRQLPSVIKGETPPPRQAMVRGAFESWQPGAATSAMPPWSEAEAPRLAPA